MPIYSEVAAKIDALTRTKGPNKGPSVCDDVRKEYLAKVNQLTGRNVIQYTTGALHKKCDIARSCMNAEDMHGFMTVINGLDPQLGLDLILHSLGGQPDAVESFIHYLRRTTFPNVRVFIPHLAQSAACMMTMGFDEIWMGNHSFLGPTDIQISGTPAHAILKQYKDVMDAGIANPDLIPLFANMMPSFGPGLLQICQRAVDLAKDLPRQWLQDHMFEGDPDALVKANRAVEYFGNADNFKSHGKHISRDEVIRNTDLKVKNLEDDMKW